MELELELEMKLELPLHVYTVMYLVLGAQGTAWGGRAAGVDRRRDQQPDEGVGGCNDNHEGKGMCVHGGEACTCGCDVM